MPLNLDLSESDAKIARARIHLEALGDLVHAVSKGRLYSIRVTEVDPDGRCCVYMTPHKIAEHDLGIVVGDLVHNLRCALDYVVTALVAASSARLTKKHQFPIYVDEFLYRKNVGDERSAKATGPLRDVVYGLDLIWGRQPFHRQPHPLDDPLHFVHEFSNADKHRVILSAMPQAIASQVKVISDGRILEERDLLPGAEWKAAEEREVKLVRFAPPYPQKLDIEANVTMMVQFTAPPFGKHSICDPVRLDTLSAMCEYVAECVDLFKTL